LHFSGGFSLLLLVLMLVAGSAQAQIGATRDQLDLRWKHGTDCPVISPPTIETMRIGEGSYFPGGKIAFPDGIAGKVPGYCFLEYSLDQNGFVRFEEWWSDGGFKARPVLKKSEPGYHWVEREANNWFGTAPGKPPLHASYEHARTNSRLYIALLSAVPSNGDFWEYKGTLCSP
jgi:hypothetical protein